MIKIQGLNKFFNKGRQNEIHVINDISLDLPERGMVAVFGKSGCGKTTLLNVIGGLDKFASGAIEIDGQSVASDPDNIRNQYVGYIFQNYNLNLAESCFDNVADALRLCGMSDEAEIERRVLAALRNVGMEKFVKRPPDTLSGGQQQRIAIARAIVKNPKIILADEPTGNLDEANTVMIMDLLKAISKDHLVILVTHEADLVDYYCDRVIELSDGQIVSERYNEKAGGFLARSKNDIYLGELERSEINGGGARIELFGDLPETPIKLRIVNNGGKLYLEIDPSVQIIDGTSEIKLREGVYEPESKGVSDREIDMSDLPPIKGERFGRLFSLASSIKSGFRHNFKNKKKGRKLLFGCLCLFSAVLVLMSAIFGTSLDQIIQARRSYNHNVFYVYLDSEETFQKINSAYANGLYGIDYYRLRQGMVNGDDAALFSLGAFETFDMGGYGDAMRTNMVLLGEEAAQGLPVVVGKGSDIGIYEVAITTGLADALLEKSSLGYLDEYDDLMGLVLLGSTIDGQYCRVAGILESDERLVFANDLTVAKLYFNRSGSPAIRVGSKYGYDVEDGKAILAVYFANAEEDPYPSIGSSVKIQGVDLTVDGRIDFRNSYEEWLDSNGIKKLYVDEYFRNEVLKENSNISTEELETQVKQMLVENYGEWLAYYYSESDAFIRNNYIFDVGNITLWIAVERNELSAKCVYLGGEAASLYIAESYKKETGEYPSYDMIMNQLYESYDMWTDYDEKMRIYENTFYSMPHEYFSGSNVYFVSDNDYVKISKSFGASDPSAMDNFYYDKYYSDGYVVDVGYGVEEVKSVYTESVVIPAAGGVYALIHTSDPKATEEFILSEFGDIVTQAEYYAPILLPSDIFKQTVSSNLEDMLGGVITMAIILVIMSVCMYFIMRSSLMSRIKEVGIYRAIGVSRRNLIFKFFVESLVLAFLTVFIGYLAVSGFIVVCSGLSPLVSELLFYPLWLAIVDLGILLSLAVVCGVLPIATLLKKTPSEIIAKYDI